LRLGIDEAAAFRELRISLPAEVMAHVEACESCGEATETFWASRKLLAGPLQIARDEQAERLEARAPWFATRVMAKIAERETEGRRAATEWSGAVSRLASRLALISGLVLLVTSTWLYNPQNTQTNSSTEQPAREVTPQYLFDSTTAPSNIDDALASPAER
jgi:hypothetical protein